jgi:c-di-GMP-related signal transduction protein
MPAPGSDSSPRAKARRHLNTWFAFTPCALATRATENAFSGDIEDVTNQIIGSCLSMIVCFLCQNPFINCTRNALVNMSVKLLPSRTVVLEILETIPSDPELASACKELQQAGFRLALDDFSPCDNKGELVEIADYVKWIFGPLMRPRGRRYTRCLAKTLSSWQRKSNAG